MKKILYGVCGIGNGHTYRQLPIIDHLAKSNRMVIFAYDNSLRFFEDYFRNNENVKVVWVAVPYYAGGRSGIDFETSARLADASHMNYVAVNAMAIAEAKEYLGVADLAITDYEPVTAQYAYAFGVPLVTIDQQSRYLAGGYPKKLNGYTYTDEVERLRMFFPRADARVACSFFNVPHSSGGEEVHVMPPILRNEIRVIKIGVERSRSDFLAYLTSAPNLSKLQVAFARVFAGQSKITFHVFLPKGRLTTERMPANVRLYEHGDEAFGGLMRMCSGIIATAGHSLLSEAMYLEIPVLALPLPLYEQQMNAEIIRRGKFGICAAGLTSDVLEWFIENLDEFAKNIRDDKEYLLRGDGRQMIIDFIEQRFL